MAKKDINSMYFDELAKDIEELKLPKFRTKQIFSRLHGKLCFDFHEMTELPEALREKLSEEYEIKSARLENRQISKLDGTEKFLFAMEDDSLVESVLMKYKHGNSVCISSQVGCRMGCKFCASTLDGLTRNLTASEMLSQIYTIQKLTGERVSNIVVMGTGEPMDNYDNLIRFIKLISDENGLNISKRNITVSTCGIVPGIRAFAEEKLPVTLALSLHSVTDEKRRTLMPIANKYSIAELMDAVDYYFKVTGRRITFEYSLVRDVNDTDEDAQGLIRLAGRVKAHVNLIPINPIKEREYRETAGPRVLAFKNKLEKSGINVTIRREMGRDIDGACGQLRKRTMDENKQRRGQGD